MKAYASGPTETRPFGIYPSIGRLRKFTLCDLMMDAFFEDSDWIGNIPYNIHRMYIWFRMTRRWCQ